MRIALVHDYLNQYGGAERVLEACMELFPAAPVYTLFYDRKATHGRFEGRVRQTSFLDYGFVRTHHRAFIPLMPVAADLLKLEDEYDAVISLSAGYGKGIAHSSRALHISYCYTPLRYAWEHYNYFEHWPAAVKLASAPAFGYLRWWDRRAGNKPDVMLAVSGYIAHKVKHYYGRDASVIYPPVDMEAFYPDLSVKMGDYFLAAGRLIHYKKFDLVVRTFNKLGLPLVIVGTGPEGRALKALATSPKITFMPFVPDADLRRLYSGARALVFPQVEDFGLVAAEAHACGTPVIAFDGGGATEIVQDGTTGILFPEQSEKELEKAIGRFLCTPFDPAIIRNSAERFSKARFQEEILNALNGAAMARKSDML